ncbi:hypothetical protein NARC_30217 [Candidatus Nitrosocosmicus arcticus]|uniref:Uncharacterized protein n=1 Tax=Candidatus Nitrosocosmicus arcticus TaxID=2035267 RepID=A0A557SY33_9ARCH|nr:hypothetical protein NARC_30217 [Candidatus Nitrosocosmicus arcticus]
MILTTFQTYTDWRDRFFIDIFQILKVVLAVDMYLNVMNQIIILISQSIIVGLIGNSEGTKKKI